MAETERVQLNIRIGSGQKELWESHAEENGQYRSVSDLVRQSVNRQVERDNGGSREPASYQAEGSGEVLDAVRHLQTAVGDMQETVAQAVGAIKAQSGLDPEVAPEVFEALPVGEDNALTVGELTETVEWDMPTVDLALESLAVNTNSVKKIPQGYDVAEGAEDAETREEAEAHMSLRQARWYREA